MNFRLSSGRIISPARGDEALLKTHSVVRGYIMRIADDSLQSLQPPQLQLNALSAFSHGLRLYPSTIPTETGTLADHHPEVLIEALVDAGPIGFAQWFAQQMSAEHYNHFREAVVDRNLYHYYEFMARGEVDLGEALKQMESEFDSIDYYAQTRWLSRLFNGLQTCVFEAYVIDQLLD